MQPSPVGPGGVGHGSEQHARSAPAWRRRCASELVVVRVEDVHVRVGGEVRGQREPEQAAVPEVVDVDVEIGEHGRRRVRERVEDLDHSRSSRRRRHVRPRRTAPRLDWSGPRTPPAPRSRADRWPRTPTPGARRRSPPRRPHPPETRGSVPADPPRVINDTGVPELTQRTRHHLPPPDRTLGPAAARAQFVEDPPCPAREPARGGGQCGHGGWRSRELGRAQRTGVLGPSGRIVTVPKPVSARSS